MSIKIVTLNARGLADTIKRRMVFNYYRSRADVLCLQETHCEEDMQPIWTSEWGGKAIFSQGTSAARGVCILLAKNIPYRMSSNSRDDEGRIVACELENLDEPDKRVTICNIYAPNQDRPAFFVNVMKLVAQMSANLILIGDYNLVLDTDIDRKGSTHNNKKAVIVLKEIIEDFSLVDIWRIRNPEKEMFSWMRAKPKYTASRLDFGLVSQGITQNIDNPMYLPGIKSDHLAFFLVYNASNAERGKGYWKLNSSHLSDINFVNGINKTIEQVRMESTNMGKVDRWKYLKTRMVKKAKLLSRRQASERELIISQLSERVLHLEHEMSANPNEKTNDLLIRSQADLEENLQQKVKGLSFELRPGGKNLVKRIRSSSTT